MLKLDLFTLEVFTTLNMLLASAGMLVVSTLNRRTDGVQSCAYSCLLFHVGFALIPARLFIPGKLIVLMPNLLVFAGMMILLDGVRAFRGLGRHTGVLFAGTLVYVFSLSYWLFVRDDINVRTEIEMVVVAICAYFLTTAMLRDVPPGDRPIYWTTAAGMGIHGIASVTKGLDALWGPPISFAIAASPPSVQVLPA